MALKGISPNLLDHGLQVGLQIHLIMPSKWTPKLTWLRPPSSHDHGLQLHLQTSTTIASKYVQSQPPSVYPNSLNYSLQVRTIMASKYFSPNPLDHGHLVHLHTYSIMAPNSVSILARSRSWSASLSSLDSSLQVYLQIRSITASKCIFKFAWSWPQSSLDHHFQVHPKLLSSTTCSQSRYTICRWVAI
jgi:hypothetical protein